MIAELRFTDSRDAVVEAVESILADRLDRAATRLRQQVVENISFPGPEGRTSSAGEFPHQDSGALMASIAVETPDQLTRRVLTDADHGLILELGSRVMAARPYLTRTLDELSVELGAIFTEGSADR